MSTPALPQSRLDFVEAAGRLWQLLGLPRSTGQIYGLLYLSPTPLSLDEIAALLSISKASASTGTRQLISWQAVRQVWIQGDRRDHYESVADVGEVLRAAYQAFFLPKLTKSQERMTTLMATLEADRKSGRLVRKDYDFCRTRLEQIEAWQGKLAKLLPLAEKLL